MTATLRLFTIEARRSVAIWFVPLIVMVAGWYANDRLSPVGVAVWRHSSVSIGETLIVLAPLMGGVAAWAGGRDRRRGVGELLATTPRPLAHRTLADWGGVVVWGVFAYAIVGAFVVVVTMRDDPWGSPFAAPVVIGLLTIVAASAIGYLAGALIPSRFAPPLVPIGLFFTIGLLNTGWFLDDRISYLSPGTLIDRQLLFMNSDSFFFTPPSLRLMPMVLWLSGLTGLALTSVVLRQRRSVTGWSALSCSAAMAAAGAALLMNAYDDSFLNGVPWDRQELMPYTPVCVDRSIPVCVHPAFEAELDRHADWIEMLIEPLAGLPGAPTRAEQLPFTHGVLADGTLAIELDGVEAAAIALIQTPEGAMQDDLRPEQIAIAIWLARRVDDQAFMQLGDFHDSSSDSRHMESAMYAAVDRFSALEPAEQRAWLAANYADLRAGRLNLDDLP